MRRHERKLRMRKKRMRKRMISMGLDEEVSNE